MSEPRRNSLKRRTKKRNRRVSKSVPFAPPKKRRKIVTSEEIFEAKTALKMKGRYGKKRQFQYTDGWSWEKFYPNLKNPDFRLRHWTLSREPEHISPYAMLNIKTVVMKYSNEEYDYIDKILRNQLKVENSQIGNSVSPNEGNQGNNSIFVSTPNLNRNNMLNVTSNQPSPQQHPQIQIQQQLQKPKEGVIQKQSNILNQPMNSSNSSQVKNQIQESENPQIIGTSMFSNPPKQFSISLNLTPISTGIPETSNQPGNSQKKEIKQISSILVRNPLPIPPVLPIPKQNIQKQSSIRKPFEVWSRKDTDELFELCEKYDLRFHVIQDRLSFRKSLESIKERYFSICQILLYVRAKGNLAEVVEHPYLMNTYDSSKEKKRKKTLINYYSRPKDAEKQQDEFRRELVIVREKMRQKKLQIRENRRKIYHEKEEERKVIHQFAIIEKNKREEKERKQLEEIRRKLEISRNGEKATIKQEKEKGEIVEKSAIIRSVEIPNIKNKLAIVPPLSKKSPPTPILIRNSNFSPIQKTENIFRSMDIEFGQPNFRNSFSSSNIIQPPPIDPKNGSINNINNKTVTKEFEPIRIFHQRSNRKQDNKKKKSRKKKKDSLKVKLNQNTAIPKPGNFERVIISKFDRDELEKKGGENNDLTKVFSRSQLMRESLFGSSLTNEVSEYLKSIGCDVESLDCYSSRVHREFLKLKEKIEEYLKKKKKNRSRKKKIK